MISGRSECIIATSIDVEHLDGQHHKALLGEYELWSIWRRLDTSPWYQRIRPHPLQ